MVAKFIQAALTASHAMPAAYFFNVGELLRDLIEEDDPRLEDQSDSALNDWLTTAINSIRGDAIEALLDLALHQKKAQGHVERWIFDLIWKRLGTPDESPAIFALLGAKLRLFVYLFGDRIKNGPDRLFCVDKPIHREAAIVAHFTYDHPMTTVIAAWPVLPAMAIASLENMQKMKDDNERDNRRNFGSQLGTHLAFYYWNAAFVTDADGEAILDWFFAVASKETRAGLISVIGSIFEKETEFSNKVSPRAMRIWERRYTTIVEQLSVAPEKIEYYERELGEFLDWLHCECFPFDWRVGYVINAINQLRKSPEAFQLLETISTYSNRPDRLRAALRILHALLSIPSDELKWSIRAKEISPLISKGLADDDSSVRQLAEQVRDLLLKLGFFEFLEVGIKQSQSNFRPCFSAIKKNFHLAKIVKAATGRGKIVRKEFRDW
jgi:hypothetical protein